MKVSKLKLSSGGEVIEKEVLLDENDDIWCELRHQVSNQGLSHLYYLTLYIV